MTPIQITRCKVLIRELKLLKANTVKPKFFMGNWMSLFLTKRRTTRELHQDIMEATRNPCGTACCLAGKAGLIPAIRRMGFKWDVYTKDQAFDLFGNARAGFQFGSHLGDAAVINFFGQLAFSDVFMNIYNIHTLLQGIKALEAVIKAGELLLEEEAEYDNS